MTRLLVAALLVTVAGCHAQPAPTVAPMPTVYVECVSNAHVSDVCLGA